MGKSSQSGHQNQKTSSSRHPADPHHHDATDGGGGGHHAPVETEEQAADGARSSDVEEAWVAAMRKPGAVISLVFGSLSLAWLASLTRTAPAMTWPWLLVLLMVFSWGLALLRGGGRADDVEPAKVSGGNEHH